jgi:hypothetical protein
MRANSRECGEWRPPLYQYYRVRVSVIIQVSTPPREECVDVTEGQ